jgi:aminoglycoside 6-adenylyltransferase
LIEAGVIYNIRMQQEQNLIEELQRWARDDDSVRAMILTGSRADPHSTVDVLSDYDVELYVEDIQPFMSDEWLSLFGEVMVKWPLRPMPTFDKDWITRLVLFASEVRIDFQITARKSVDPLAYDAGFRVLIDKRGLTKDLNKATFSRYIIIRPAKEDYEALVNAFFWDACYVAKHLWRDEVYFAKYMLDCLIRFEHLRTIIEWYVSTRNGWSVSTGNYGRLFKRHIDAATWAELEATFADASLENNWQAFFNLIGLFRKLATYVAQDLGYDYPDALDRRVTAYCRRVKDLNRM